MAKSKKRTDPDTKSKPVAKKRSRILQTDIPGHALEDALRIPRAIHENYGADPTKPFDVAAAMDLRPGSSQFKMLSAELIEQYPDHANGCHSFSFCYVNSIGQAASSDPVFSAV